MSAGLNVQLYRHSSAAGRQTGDGYQQRSRRGRTTGIYLLEIWLHPHEPLLDDAFHTSAANFDVSQYPS